MEKQQVTGTFATLELTKDELDFIVYLYNTNTKKLNKKEVAFFVEIEALIRTMDEKYVIEKYIK